MTIKSGGAQGQINAEAFKAKVTELGSKKPADKSRDIVAINRAAEQQRIPAGFSTDELLRLEYKMRGGTLTAPEQARALWLQSYWGIDSYSSPIEAVISQVGDAATTLAHHAIAFLSNPGEAIAQISRGNPPSPRSPSSRNPAVRREQQAREASHQLDTLRRNQTRVLLRTLLAQAEVEMWGVTIANRNELTRISQEAELQAATQRGPEARARRERLIQILEANYITRAGQDSAPKARSTEAKIAREVIPWLRSLDQPLPPTAADVTIIPADALISYDPALAIARDAAVEMAMCTDESVRTEAVPPEPAPPAHAAPPAGEPAAAPAEPAPAADASAGADGEGTGLVSTDDPVERARAIEAEAKGWQPPSHLDTGEYKEQLESISTILLLMENENAEASDSGRAAVIPKEQLYRARGIVANILENPNLLEIDAIRESFFRVLLFIEEYLPQEYRNGGAAIQTVLETWLGRSLQPLRALPEQQVERVERVRVKLRELENALSTTEDPYDNLLKEVEQHLKTLKAGVGENEGEANRVLPGDLEAAEAFLERWQQKSLVLHNARVVAPEAINYHVLSAAIIEFAENLADPSLALEQNLIAGIGLDPDIDPQELTEIIKGLQENVELVSKRLRADLQNLETGELERSQFEANINRHAEIIAQSLVLTNRGRGPHAQAILANIQENLEWRWLHVLERILKSPMGPRAYEMDRALELIPPTSRQRFAMQLNTDARNVVARADLADSFVNAGLTELEAIHMVEQILEEHPGGLLPVGTPELGAPIATGYNQLDSQDFITISTVLESLASGDMSSLELTIDRDEVIRKAGYGIALSAEAENWRQRGTWDFSNAKNRALAEAHLVNICNLIGVVRANLLQQERSATRLTLILAKLVPSLSERHRGDLVNAARDYSQYFDRNQNGVVVRILPDENLKRVNETFTAALQDRLGEISQEKRARIIEARRSVAKHFNTLRTKPAPARAAALEFIRAVYDLFKANPVLDHEMRAEIQQESTFIEFVRTGDNPDRMLKWLNTQGLFVSELPLDAPALLSIFKTAHEALTPASTGPGIADSASSVEHQSSTAVSRGVPRAERDADRRDSRRGRVEESDREAERPEIDRAATESRAGRGPGRGGRGHGPGRGGFTGGGL